MGHKLKRKQERKRLHAQEFRESLAIDKVTYEDNVALALLEDSIYNRGALQAFVAAIEHYPISRSELLFLAHAQHAPTNVINFFEYIPVEVMFYSEEDILTRLEEEQLILAESLEQVDEHLNSYD
jgi:hypothetical protein